MHRFKYPFKKKNTFGGLPLRSSYTTDYHSSNTVLWSKEMFLNVRLKNIFSNDFKLFIFVYIYNYIICTYPQIDTFLSVNAKKTSHNIF